MLPLAYALIAALSPLMPYLLEDLEAPLGWQTPLTATWMFARVAGITALRFSPWWHGRWTTTLVGRDPPRRLHRGDPRSDDSRDDRRWSCSDWGRPSSTTPRLYYVMRVGDADVDAASTHEGLIGVGYAVGPAAAGVGVLLGGGGLVVVSSLSLPAIAAWPALRPWFRSRVREVTGTRPSSNISRQPSRVGVSKRNPSRSRVDGTASTPSSSSGSAIRPKAARPPPPEAA